MKQIYSLEEDLKEDPSHVELAQKLTLDKSRPMMGLKGMYGLFGSKEWWNNIYSRVIPRKEYEGVIEDIHFSGMHNESKSFRVALFEGGTYTYSCVSNKKNDLSLYKVGTCIKVDTYIETMKDGRELDFVLSIEIENA